MSRVLCVCIAVTCILLAGGCQSTAPEPADVAVSAVGQAVTCPFTVYSEWGSAENHFVPEGWMGDIADVAFDDNHKLDPERPSVIRIQYSPAGSAQYAGVYWWDPAGGNWAEVDGGFDLSCAKKLTFWARGERGGEKAEFKVGGLRGTYQCSLQPAVSTGPIVLTDSWAQYTIALDGKPLDHILGGFAWVTSKAQNPEGAVIYLDDVRFEP